MERWFKEFMETERFENKLKSLIVKYQALQNATAAK